MILELVESGERELSRELLYYCVGSGIFSEAHTLSDAHGAKVKKLKRVLERLNADHSILYGKDGRQNKRIKVANEIEDKVKTSEPQQLLQILANRLSKPVTMGKNINLGTSASKKGVVVSDGVVGKATTVGWGDGAHVGGIRLKVPKKVVVTAIRVTNEYVVTGSSDGMVEIYQVFSQSRTQQMLRRESESEGEGSGEREGGNSAVILIPRGNKESCIVMEDEITDIDILPLSTFQRQSNGNGRNNEQEEGIMLATSCKNGTIELWKFFTTTTTTITADANNNNDDSDNKHKGVLRDPKSEKGYQTKLIYSFKTENTENEIKSLTFIETSSNGGGFGLLYSTWNSIKVIGLNSRRITTQYTLPTSSSPISTDGSIGIGGGELSVEKCVYFSYSTKDAVTMDNNKPLSTNHVDMYVDTSMVIGICKKQVVWWDSKNPLHAYLLVPPYMEKGSNVDGNSRNTNRVLDISDFRIINTQGLALESPLKRNSSSVNTVNNEEVNHRLSQTSVRGYISCCYNSSIINLYAFHGLDTATPNNNKKICSGDGTSQKIYSLVNTLTLEDAKFTSACFMVMKSPSTKTSTTTADKNNCHDKLYLCAFDSRTSRLCIFDLLSSRLIKTTAIHTPTPPIASGSTSANKHKPFRPALDTNFLIPLPPHPRSFDCVNSKIDNTGVLFYSTATGTGTGSHITSFSIF
ncbi:hypothetical protein AX774_g2361 [Zancudomyces culisetae]|uniref:Uncharacterized protein n=1 Tax=Zancudomyces culisetae TaxID=1213189 RepID=A0A1R1PNI0_ZANCU|nr:hypothetical protein AX774_g3992 [Zancudomyces culisetae]OMH84134.1 hypothetical protein AX774_g2361 [Zancudomyces culisetae]|eukprot:OMH82527.1 hypothetical protein AX774_g3992 [Zancudomyces culisetae]